MANDPDDPLAGLDEFLRGQASPAKSPKSPPPPPTTAPPVIRTGPRPGSLSSPQQPSQRLVITRLQVTAASLIISLVLAVVSVLLMLLFGFGLHRLGK